MKKIDQLKKNGFRITKPRKAILDVLASRPVTVHEIYELVQKKNISIDLVSIYRTLELFMQIKLVQQVEFGEGKKRYELLDDANHHHHLICNNCGKVEDITINETAFIKKLTITSQFKIDHHHLEFFGACAACQ